MIDDDDDFDFDQEFSEEDNKEFERQRKEEERKLNEHPLFVQANEILNIVDALMDTAEEDARHMHEALLKESAMIICAKLASGLTSESYVICMQKASIIRDHAEFLRLSNHTLEYCEGLDPNYIKMFREEMEKFRNLFKIWAAEIHKMIPDFEDENWGLFVK